MEWKCNGCYSAEAEEIYVFYSEAEADLMLDEIGLECWGVLE